jgi:uncharacterized protein YcbK (DUF882 family)
MEIPVKYFELSEFNCQHTGNNEMKPEFLEKLDQLRHVCGFPFVVTSGYRDPSHPIEAAKDIPGTHASGIAADIRVVSSNKRFRLVKEALALGFTGIGVDPSFIHLDIRASSPVIWTY